MATGENLTAAKAKAAAAWTALLLFLAPGLAVLVPEVAPGGNGISGQELLWALLLSLLAAAGGGAAVGTVVYHTENKPRI
jgi:hypothetical protein